MRETRPSSIIPTGLSRSVQENILRKSHHPRPMPCPSPHLSPFLLLRVRRSSTRVRQCQGKILIMARKKQSSVRRRSKNRNRSPPRPTPPRQLQPRRELGSGGLALLRSPRSPVAQYLFPAE